jgi:hypothetical protein
MSPEHRLLTLDQLSAAKRLDRTFLEGLGLHDLPAGGVGIPYYDVTGQELLVKRRTALAARDGSYWPVGQPLQAYGQWRLADARRAAILFLVEGESDCWTLWHRGVPALGLPGANTARCLNAEHLEGLAKLYVVREPDRGGEAFVQGVTARLRELGFAGKAFAIRCPGGAKDPSELHLREPAAFLKRLEEAILASTPLDLAPALPLAGAGPKFASPIPASRLEHLPGPLWLWHGYLARGSITLLSALWKSGKTTLLAHLLRQLEHGGDFCGLPLQAGRALYVTEESQSKWADRRDKLGLKDHVEFLVRPFAAKPDWAAWLAFLAHLRDLCARRPFDLLVFDTLANLWPVRDENDDAQVQAALMPLHQLDARANQLLVHHNRKGDGQEATAARGSGALAAFVDTIVELRRFDPRERHNRQRVLTGYGRFDETPEERVIELTAAGVYVSHGTRQEVASRDLAEVLVELLPEVPPGLTSEEILAAWPGRSRPLKQKLLHALRQGTEQRIWQREGEGKRRSPYRFWRPVSADISVSVSSLYRERTETETAAVEGA